MAESIDIRELNERIERQSAFVTNLTTGMDQIIVGQKHLVESVNRTTFWWTRAAWRCTGFGKNFGH